MYEFAKSGATVIIGSRDVKKSNEIVKKCEVLKGKVISRKLNLTKANQLWNFLILLIQDLKELIYL